MFSNFLKSTCTNIASFFKNILDFFGFGYKKFIKEHSISIKKLDQLNSKYTFFQIGNFKIPGTYDNKIFYDSISPKDYLTYQLIYKRKEIESLIKKADYNEIYAGLYKEEIDRIYAPGIFDIEDTPKNQHRLLKIEKRLFDKRTQKPPIDFDIWVRLTLTKINGNFVAYKQEPFHKTEIKKILTRMSDRNGDFYNDKKIWDSICRVERGRVTNKMRFAIYKRDGYRCVKCGRRNVDLEVDHIFPIAKGGKSNFDNLQTLCHRCNALKSDTIEPGIIDSRSHKKKAFTSNEICPNCNIPMVIRHGSYGDFYGCQNYPNCKYTKNMN